MYEHYIHIYMTRCAHSDNT